MTVIEISLLIYIAVVNLTSFIIFGIDKQKAKGDAWRISENTLMTFAAVGGSIGALSGMYTFHHKTRHAKFTIGVPIILSIHIILAVCVSMMIFG